MSTWLSDEYLSLLNVNVALAPARRTGSIPVEVYFIIFDHLKALYEDGSLTEYRKLLSSLCLVCRMFCDELQRILFRTLTHEGDAHSRLRHWSNYREWQRMIQLQDPRAMRLASYVREFSATLRPADSAVVYDLGVGLSLPAIVPHLRSLESITLSYCMIPDEAFSAFACMPNLSTISLDECFFAPDSMSSVHPEHATWTSVSVTRTECTHRRLSTFPQFVDVDNLHYLRVDDWCLAASLLETRPAPKLTKLHLDAPCPSTSSLSAILTNTPNLTHLTISSEHCALPNAPSALIPHLTHLTAHPALAAQLTVGRPVHSLTLLWSEHALRARTLSPQLAPAASSAPLTTLSIPSRCVPWLRADDAPGLRTLVLRPLCGARERRAVWKTSRWEPFAVSRSLLPCGAHADGNAQCGHVPPEPIAGPTTVVYALDHACCAACAALALAPDRQRRLFVDAAAPRFPHATTIRFGAAVEWRRRGEAWTPHVVSRAVVRGLLLARRGALDDVDGCLRAVLEAGGGGIA